MIKTILFDVDGVLFDSFHANLRFFQIFMPTVGYPSPTEDDYQQLFHLPMYDVIEALIQPSQKKEVERVFNESKKFASNYPSNLVTTPKRMSETIQALGKTYMLGIVTSRIRSKLLEYPQLVEVKDYFKTVVFYEDTKKHKPNPEPLLYAMDQFRSLPNETVYVGDADTDAQAAESAHVHFLRYSNNNMGNNKQSILFEEIPKEILKFTR